MSYFMYSFILIMLVLVLFSLSSKSTVLESLGTSVFECGFTSYYFSRFSFSIHYFTIGIIFLFLDLELCYLFPFFSETFSELKLTGLFWAFILILVVGLLGEWKEGMLDWKE